jgi:nicotinate-nucleotide adenylyltransferase
MREGLFGGTFNPVHLGHLSAAKTVMSQLALDRLRFIPSGHPPLKGAMGLVAGHHRAAMIRLAIGDHPGMEVCEDEISRPGPSFTVETLTRLHEQAPAGTTFHFLLGDDCLSRLPQWKGIADIRRMARFAIIRRNGCLPDDLGPDIDRVDMPGLPVSSTEVRERLANGRDVTDLVGPDVAVYINQHRLYGAVQEGG